MFLGILIKMNWKDTGQHNTPHFHAFYGEHEAVFGFDGEIIAGSFPRRQSVFVKAWALIHEGRVGRKLETRRKQRSDIQNRPPEIGGKA